VTTPSSLPSSAEGAPAPATGTRLERGLLTFFLLAMVALPAASTVSRRLTGRELPGSAVLAQHITLWVGFLGALLATASGHHLALSTIDLVPEGRPRRAARFFTGAVSAAACALLAWASARLVAVEWEGFGTVAFGIRVAWSELVMPIGFGFMVLRFAWRAGEARALPPAPRRSPSPQARSRSAQSRLARRSSGSSCRRRGLPAGAPVFVAMAGVAMVLFFRDGGPRRSRRCRRRRSASSPPPPFPPSAPHRGWLCARRGRRGTAAGPRVQGSSAGCRAASPSWRRSSRAVFTTFTGASGVTIRARRPPPGAAQGYPEDFSVGLVTASGSLGLLFPPSLPVILYGVVAQAPIDHLFLGGLLPGLLMIVIVAAYGVVVGVRSRAPRERFEPREAAAALWAAKWDLGLPTLVVVVVATGFATIVEAAALAAAYSIVVELFIFRSIQPLRDLPRVLVDAAALIGSVLILLGTALGLTSWFVDAEIPTRLVEWMTSNVRSPALFLLLLNAVLLVLGSVLEIYSAIVVLAPLVAPLGAAYGIEPIHLGVVFLANLELGFLFPPMGLNLFLAASRFGKPLPYMYRKAFPFLLLMAAGVLAITYLPAITTGVVELLVRR
jgi:tripartite ATP-independent transporter DctM subunit